MSASSMIDAYLAACKACGDRPKEECAAALGGDDGDTCFRLKEMALVSLPASPDPDLRTAFQSGQNAQSFTLHSSLSIRTSHILCRSSPGTGGLHSALHVGGTQSRACFLRG